MEVVGDRWSLLIVNEALVGAKRFGQFRRRLGVASNILSARLYRLEEFGIIASAPIKHRSPVRDYLLTEKGLGLLMVIAAMLRWESEFRET